MRLDQTRHQSSIKIEDESTSNAEESLDGAKNQQSGSKKIVGGKVMKRHDPRDEGDLTSSANKTVDGPKSWAGTSKKIAGGKVKGRKDPKNYKSSHGNEEKPISTVHDAKSWASSRKTIVKEDGGNAGKRKATSKPVDDSRRKRLRGASRQGRIL